jgi:hypothetical protein
MQVVLVAGTCNCENAIVKVPENGTIRFKDCSFLSNWCTSYWDSGALFIMNDQSFSIVVKTQNLHPDHAEHTEIFRTGRTSKA